MKKPIGIVRIPVATKWSGADDEQRIRAVPEAERIFGGFLASLMAELDKKGFETRVELIAEAGPSCV